jgi:hypothetical protein
MDKKTFLVTVSDYYHVTPATVENVLRNTFESSMYDLESVRVFNPEDYHPISKIAAIKRIREVLNLGLHEAKHIADTAQRLGSFKWMNVTVHCDNKGPGYEGSLYRVEVN